MGEAKRRKDEIERLKNANPLWEAGLTAPERTIKEVALKVHKHLVLDRDFTGGCYLLAFFLQVYLQDRHGIEASARNGYVNDGTGAIMTSHATL